MVGQQRGEISRQRRETNAEEGPCYVENGGLQMLCKRFLSGKNEFLKREKQKGIMTSESGPRFDNKNDTA